MTKQTEVEWKIWGLSRISALKFLNGPGTSTHGNLKLTSIFISESGEWKLSGLKALGGLFPEAARYASPELMKTGYEVLKELDPASARRLASANRKSRLKAETFGEITLGNGEGGAVSPSAAVSSTIFYHGADGPTLLPGDFDLILTILSCILNDRSAVPSQNFASPDRAIRLSLLELEATVKSVLLLAPKSQGSNEHVHSATSSIEITVAVSLSKGARASEKNGDVIDVSALPPLTTSYSTSPLDGSSLEKEFSEKEFSEKEFSEKEFSGKAILGEGVLWRMAQLRVSVQLEFRELEEKQEKHYNSNKFQTDFPSTRFDSPILCVFDHPTPNYLNPLTFRDSVGFGSIFAIRLLARPDNSNHGSFRFLGFSLPILIRKTLLPSQKKRAFIFPPRGSLRFPSDFRPQDGFLLHAGDTQHLKDLFNIISAYPLPIIPTPTRHQPLDLSCHTSNHPSIIHDSLDQRSKSNRLAHPPLPIRRTFSYESNNASRTTSNSAFQRTRRVQPSPFFNPTCSRRYEPLLLACSSVLPQIDSLICSRHTKHSDHINTPNGEMAINSSAAYQPSLALAAPKPLCFSSAQSHPFNAFSDFNHAAQHLQGEVGLVLKVESNSANSSPNDFGQKSFTDARRASTDPSSPQLNNVNLVPPSACDGYDHNQPCQIFFPSQSIIPSAQSMTTTDRSTSAANTNHSKSGNALVSGNHHLFGFASSHCPTKVSRISYHSVILLEVTISNVLCLIKLPAFAPTMSVDHAFKFAECNTVSNTNSLGLLPPYNQPRASYMEKIPENLVVLGKPGSAGLSKLTSHSSEETGHNAVETRYCNNINSHIRPWPTCTCPSTPPLFAFCGNLETSLEPIHCFNQCDWQDTHRLSDGVKAATKLSKGNILSKSVDYMRHLLRRRAELKEDIEDLKEVVKSRVDGGEFLILQWEVREDGDEDDDMHDSNHKKNNGAPHGNSGPNLSKKRKVADLKLGDTTKLKGGKLHGKGIRETSHTTDFETIALARLIRSR
ncbi:hypothetical protein H4Q26_006475 [Puccinia striiformis f. sp. tritici PST-130]|nr:hypothetical protein H4Q26_006475 [Puccinia striiformis f. sp. tritici PST-130]